VPDAPATAIASGTEALVRSYNDVPYTSSPSPSRHPDRLATIGTLLGLDVAPIATARVLELACGDGSNLVAIAATLPAATFTGFDFAAVPIARARRMAEDLGVTNVRLFERDLRAPTGDLDSFDYIIAHGLYSWVPADVRARVMPLIARHLAPNGVAYVSYNTLPGCHLRAVVWEMLKYHTRDIGDKPGKVAAARALLELVATPAGDDDVGQQALRAEVRNASRSSDASLAHDDLSEFNDPVYFHAFVDDASRAGLTFLAEAELGTMLGSGLAPQVRHALGRIDRLAREQYLDFVHFRHFRESLLCQANAVSQFSVDPERARSLHVLPSFRVRRAAAGTSGMHAQAAPDVDAVMRMLLARWPRSVSVPELDAWCAHHASAKDDRDAATRTQTLVAECYAAGMVELRTAPVAVAAAAGERPEAFAAARWINRERDVIPSLYHEALRYQDPVGRTLLALLDGTRNRDALVAALGGRFAGPDGRAQLDGVLNILAAKALLIG
jgi:SAM-dependent methyltransferase